jgi:ribosome-associated protein
MENKLNNSKEIARKIVAVLIEKKALDVKLFENEAGNPICDYYVNASGRSSTQVSSLADEVCYQLSLLGVNERSIEGRAGKSWLLIDFGDVVVNIFDRPSREFYDIDRLFSKVTELSIDDIISDVDNKLNINSEEK